MVTKCVLYCFVSFFVGCGAFRPPHTPFRKWAVHFAKGDGYYPISRNYYEDALKRLNSINQSVFDNELLSGGDTNTSWMEQTDESIIIIHHRQSASNHTFGTGSGVGDGAGLSVGEDIQRLERRNNAFKRLMDRYNNENGNGRDGSPSTTVIKSENFEVVQNVTMTFADIGGFQNIKNDLMQCVDMLNNWETYARFSVRTPKGVVLEGPPGNGKTMLARAIAGESGVAFIPVSGAEFQDKYIGVGSAKVRELFTLAMENRPCIIFIDEMDALGRRRSDGGESGGGGGAERDNTLNQLLVEMDGFRNHSGIFVVGATNRADLLDPALIRPGRIDKRIYVGPPDVTARRFIIDIHIRGKPNTLGKDGIDELVSITGGFSGAEIENLLNEGMLFALKNKREVFHWADIEVIYNRMLGGAQSEDHVITDELLSRICVHEMGHSLLGLLCKNHPLMKKVVINLSSPKNPGMTIFEEAEDEMLTTRESLFERICILYGGQIAEALIYGEAMISNGAISDYEEARKLAQTMVIQYGMGGRYSGLSETSNARMDADVEKLLADGYTYAYSILQTHRDSIISGSAILKRDLVVTRKDLMAYLMIGQ